ncbi:hypothetical protein EDC04DRAFT_2961168 [Pisolithus marmoratus]|nr:hypothetical protein EDC04DRAFT_2961168 [Pisolithus marmoratus]
MASANLVHWTELACLFNEQTGAESGQWRTYHPLCEGPLLEASCGLPEIGSHFVYGLLLVKIPLIHLYACLTMATATAETVLVSLREAALWLYSELDFTSWSRACKQCGAHPAELQYVFSLTDRSSSGRPRGGDLDLVVSKGKGESEGEVTGEVLMINACIIIANIYVYLTTSEHI